MAYSSTDSYKNFIANSDKTIKPPEEIQKFFEDWEKESKSVGKSITNNFSLSISKGYYWSILYHTSFLDSKYQDIKFRQRYEHIITGNLDLVYCPSCLKSLAKFTLSFGYGCCSKECTKIKKNKTTVDTSMRKYGVSNPILLKSNKEKLSASIKNSADKSKSTMMTNHGVESPMYSNDIKQKVINTWSNKIKDQLLTKGYNIISNSIGKIELEHIKCGSVCVHNKSDLSTRLRNDVEPCHKCRQKYVSSAEIELRDFITSLGVTNAIYNSRNIIPPYEIDIFLPDHKLALEYNGLYWHSDSKKGRIYHQKKTLECKSKGIRLINVWEDDWMSKTHKIKGIIKSTLGIFEKIIYARKCEIKLVNCNNFIKDNHLQSLSNRKSINYALIYENEIIHAITFYNNGNGSYEIDRLVSKIGYKIVGGTNRLFKHFLKNHSPKFVKTFSDASIFTGIVYLNLGFKPDGITQPSYYYFKDIKEVPTRFNRINFQKHKLVKMGYNPTLSESEIMAGLGYGKFYDSGNYKFVFENCDFVAV